VARPLTRYSRFFGQSGWLAVKSRTGSELCSKGKYCRSGRRESNVLLHLSHVAVCERANALWSLAQMSVHEQVERILRRSASIFIPIWFTLAFLPAERTNSRRSRF
jgi:hypothetical protein